MRVTCIIPFHNEYPQILEVVAAVIHVKQINQIICVDDGSTDGGGELVKTKFPSIILIKLGIQTGKAGAVSSALKKVKNDLILLLDGDLKYLSAQELTQALEIYQEKVLDLLILRNKGKNEVTDRILRKDIILSGKRILSKNDLAAVLKLKPVGYQLEVAINKYMFDLKKNVAWMESSAYNPHKVEKYTFISGSFKDLQMQINLIKFIGLSNYIKQMLWFCKKQIFYYLVS